VSYKEIEKDSKQKHRCAEAQAKYPSDGRAMA
jgi:hypothetical protein